jgi:hypothetical protein
MKNIAAYAINTPANSLFDSKNLVIQHRQHV